MLLKISSIPETRSNEPEKSKFTELTTDVMIEISMSSALICFSHNS